MSGVQGASVVVPFPAMDPPVRLRSALRRLETALAEQAQAVAAWRGSLASLHASARTLENSTNAYAERLRALSAGVAALHTTARELARISE